MYNYPDFWLPSPCSQCFVVIEATQKAIQFFSGFGAFLFCTDDGEYRNG